MCCNLFRTLLHSQNQIIFTWQKQERQQSPTPKQIKKCHLSASQSQQQNIGYFKAGHNNCCHLDHSIYRCCNIQAGYWMDAWFVRGAFHFNSCVIYKGFESTHVTLYSFTIFMFQKTIELNISDRKHMFSTEANTIFVN